MLKAAAGQLTGLKKYNNKERRIQSILTTHTYTRTDRSRKRSSKTKKKGAKYKQHAVLCYSIHPPILSPSPFACTPPAMSIHSGQRN